MIFVVGRRVAEQVAETRVATSDVETCAVIAHTEKINIHIIDTVDKINQTFLSSIKG